MSSRKKDELTVSFFSFQDIITSVTGIMFLVVLLILLLIFDIPVEDVIAPKTQSVAELQKQCESLRAEFENLDEILKQNEKQNAEILALQLDQLPEKMSQAEKEGQALKIILDNQHNAQQSAQRYIEESRRTLEKLTRQNARQMADIEVASREIPELKKELQSLQQQLKSQRNQIEITVERDENKRPILVDCGPLGIRCRVIGEEDVHDFTDKTDIEHMPSIKRFVTWVAKRDKGTEYYVLLVKPSAFGYASLLMNVLRDAGFERGAEVIPDDEAEVL